MTNLLFVYPRKVTLRETSLLMCIEKAKREDKREVKVAAKKQLCLVLHFILFFRS